MKTFTLTITEEHLKLAEKAAQTSNKTCSLCTIAQALKARFSKVDSYIAYATGEIDGKMFDTYDMKNAKKCRLITKNSHLEEIASGHARETYAHLLPMKLKFKFID